MRRFNIWNEHGQLDNILNLISVIKAILICTIKILSLNTIKRVHIAQIILLCERFYSTSIFVMNLEFISM